MHGIGAGYEALQEFGPQQPVRRGVRREIGDLPAIDCIENPAFRLARKECSVVWRLCHDQPAARRYGRQ